MPSKEQIRQCEEAEYSDFLTGLVYTGWFIPCHSWKLHFFIDSISLCKKHTHYGDVVADPENGVFPDRYLCARCYCMLSEKIIIAGRPVPLEPIRKYIRFTHSKKVSDKEKRDKLWDAIFNAAGFSNFDDAWVINKNLPSQSSFGAELSTLLGLIDPVKEYDTADPDVIIDRLDDVSEETKRGWHIQPRV